MLSVVIPTYNERENMGLLLERLSRALGELGMESEVIVVDDDSPDRTWEAAQEFTGLPGMRVIRRVSKKGLASAVFEGARASRGDVICVMDADLSHPPEAIPRIMSRLGENDIVVASRRVTGGGAENWPASRRLASWAGRLAVRPLVSVRDPMSGFFFVKRDVLYGMRFRPRGFKILLDILVRSRAERIEEIPYLFKDRRRGTSKLKLKTLVDYALQVFDLYTYRIV